VVRAVQLDRAATEAAAIQDDVDIDQHLVDPIAIEVDIAPVDFVIEEIGQRRRLIFLAELDQAVEMILQIVEAVGRIAIQLPHPSLDHGPSAIRRHAGLEDDVRLFRGQRGRGAGREEKHADD
jgi:hypothetical protein